MKERRWGSRALGVLIVLGLAALGTVVLRQLAGLESPGAPLSGRATLAEAAATVNVIRDPFGVPHIEASNFLDGLRGLGFAHAQDRLWQMEVLRRAASGRLSELFGPETLAQDRMARTFGLLRGAAREVDRLPAGARTALEAYASGVNAWIQKLRSQRGWLPPEMRWLSIEPEPWTAAQTLSVLQMRAFLMSRSLGANRLLERLNRDLGGLGAQDFFPTQPAGVPPRSTARIGTFHALGRVADRFATTVGLRGRVGSLGFLIGSTQSQSERPLLANDPHIEFQMPALFYLAHVETPELAISGATWPGIPVFWVGTNRRIAWGQVALDAVVSDVFDENLHPEDPKRYDVNGRWVDAEHRVEEIQVRFGAAQRIDVIETRHGPLLGALLPGDENATTYALRWAAAGTDSGIDALLRLQAADGWRRFRAALADFPGPPATFLYADRDGGMGTQVAGRLPIRPVPSGLLSVPGEYDWIGYVPFEELPSAYGRSLRWRVVSTRGDGTPFTQPVEWLWQPGGAASRLRSELRRRKRVSLDDVLLLQRDQVSSRGTEAVRALLGDVQGESIPARRIAQILRSWDGSTTRESQGASVYHVFRQVLVARLLQERFGHSEGFEVLARQAEPLPGVVLARFLDRFEKRIAAEMVESSLADTWTWLGLHVSGNPQRWSWGELHQVRLGHAFERLGDERLGWIGRWLSRGPAPAPGDPDSIWTMYQEGEPTDPVRVGPALRYAVDLADPNHAQVGLAGGQSGAPGSRNYDDAFPLWLRGEPRPLWMHRSDVAYHETGRWTLEPVPPGGDTP